ncbi:recombination regulator RecX [Metabacillus arenae]|uniref:Regulatory protein RecX n=1 Tax=Metabacillus arenae TaxID=2771434 RepID=A0A926RX00_9BACI|nr:recombination regulator RecX [Metabacillus arenae]MBD1379652.1 recombination regulator RecX [Metabacillus arenae]
MPFITKITTQKKNSERFNIYLDDKYAFSVDQDIFIKYSLQKGKELDELDMFEIQYGDDVKKAFNIAVNYLSYRMRAIREVMDYLRQKEIDDAVIQEVIHKLKEYNYVNDSEFANSYVRTQFQSNRKGPELIRKELVTKGIDVNEIEEALSLYSEEQQIDAALSTAEKVVKKENRLSTTERRQKIEQTLARKGFPFSIIHIVLEEIDYKKDENEEWGALKLQAEKAKKKYRSEESFQYKLKMKQFLYRKGFELDLIEQYLNEEEEDFI